LYLQAPKVQMVWGRVFPPQLLAHKRFCYLSNLPSINRERTWHPPGDYDARTLLAVLLLVSTFTDPAWLLSCYISQEAACLYLSPVAVFMIATVAGQDLLLYSLVIVLYESTVVDCRDSTIYSSQDCLSVH
jgi:hypothetical protein